MSPFPPPITLFIGFVYAETCPLFSVDYIENDGSFRQIGCFETFDEAIQNNPNAHPLFHSDRGFQYTSKAFHKKLMKAGMRQSMSRVGRCIDNGPMEGYWGILKSEMYYLKKFTSQEELTKAIEDYIIFYNTKRYQLKLKCMTPMEYHSAAAA